jgi:hypothetical protein
MRLGLIPVGPVILGSKARKETTARALSGSMTQRIHHKAERG